MIPHVQNVNRKTCVAAKTDSRVRTRHSHTPMKFASRKSTRTSTASCPERFARNIADSNSHRVLPRIGPNQDHAFHCDPVSLGAPSVICTPLRLIAIEPTQWAKSLLGRTYSIRVNCCAECSRYQISASKNAAGPFISKIEKRDASCTSTTAMWPATIRDIANQLKICGSVVLSWRDAVIHQARNTTENIDTTALENVHNLSGVAPKESSSSGRSDRNIVPKDRESKICNRYL